MIVGENRCGPISTVVSNLLNQCNIVTVHASLPTTQLSCLHALPLVVATPTSGPCNTPTMDRFHLIENIRKEHVYVQNERESIHQLNLDIAHEIESTFKFIWTTKHQRYICDKLSYSEHSQLYLLEEFNRFENIEFLEGYKKFGPNEAFISQIFQYLRCNPKAVSYLLFFSEKECPQFLDFLCKIVISTIYSHCYLDQDKSSLVDMIEELIEIYTNFYNDFRRQMHSKSSSFGIIYRYFCEELPELKIFFKLALNNPIMLVLSEDTLFLDIDSSRAAMRFSNEEKKRHFGNENTPEYQENLLKYHKWTLNKLKLFVTSFIRSLKENILTFPHSLATLIGRLYSKLIERYEYPKVYSVLIDMIFFYLLCPAIQNPDLFGISNLHINHIAHYNLMQCAQVLQMLALSTCESVSKPYQDICDLFDKNCLQFIIDHILRNANTQTIQRTFHLLSVPYFVISEVELKLLLEYIRMFLNGLDQHDNPLKVYFDKIPEAVLDFELTFSASSEGVRSKKSKSTDFEFVNINISQMIKSEHLSPIKLLTSSKQTFLITNSDHVQHFIGMKNEDKVLGIIKDKSISITEDLHAILTQVEDIFNTEVNTILNQNLALSEERIASFGFSIDSTDNQLSSDNLLTDLDASNSNVWSATNSIENNLHSLGTLSLSFKDMFLEPNLNDETNIQLPIVCASEMTSEVIDLIDECPDKLQVESNNISQRSQNLSKKVLSGFKNIKDKVRNISLKDNKSRETNNVVLNDSIQSQPESKVTIETVKAETEEIFGKYKGSATNVAAVQDLLTGSPSHPKVDSCFDLVDSSPCSPVDYTLDIKSKIRKLMCSVNLSMIYQNYRYLNLENKNDFIIFLKILLSQSRNVDDIPTSVMIMDILRVVENLSLSSFCDIFKQIEMDMKTRKIFLFYLQNARQYLLQTLEQIRSSQTLHRKEQHITNFIAISFIVRNIMDQKDASIRNLINEFRNPILMSDDKASLVNQLMIEMANLFQCTSFSNSQEMISKQVIERHLMSRIYLFAFYPNGEVDKERDLILHQQISRLSETVTHESQLLKIPNKYYTTSPWPSAQNELLLMGAYKAPRDKVHCVFRSCAHIMTLLSTCGNSIPSADDLLPVLIFVVLKANPHSILSTIQYINTFYSTDLAGEEAYYWTQFCSAVEFIKTILN